MITNFYHDPAIDITLASLTELDVRLKLPRSASHVEFLTWNKAKRAPALTAELAAHRWAETADYAYYRFNWTSIEPRVRYLQYIFKFTWEGRELWLDAYGLHEHEPSLKGRFEFPYAGDRDTIHAPDWIRDRVWYQIFPERFCNGSTDNDPEDVMPWGTEPTRENTMGGDLRGIIDKLEYLQQLGVNALYLNPIFTGKSNHKYDTLDYFTIDPEFGTIADLKELTDRCHERGMKIVLDLVINHCGYDHPMFQDLIERGEQSPYRDWFYVHEFPISLSDSKYDSVWYYQWMPKLKTSNPQVRQYVYDIVSFWQSETGIDGWRIDVADEVEVSFLRELNSRVKLINKDAFIISEIWHDAKPLMMSGGTDSVMNYELRDILLEYVADRAISLAQFHARLVRYTHRYSSVELNQMFNLLGSHDTERIMTRCGGRLDIIRLLVAMQMTMQGNPVIYYGDELGLTGDNDPGCRACMPWDTNCAELPLWSYIREWNRLKTTIPALQLGRIELLCREEEQLYAVKRTDRNESVILVVNFSEQPVNWSKALSRFTLAAADYRQVMLPGTGDDNGGLQAHPFALYLSHTIKE